MRRMDGREPWERFKRETSKSYQAFTVYLSLGRKRSLAKANTAMDKVPGYVRQFEIWSAKYKWVERAAEWDAAEDVKRLEIERAKRLEDYQNSLKIARGMAAKVAAKVRLQQGDDLTAKEAAVWMQTAHNVIRTTHGDPTQIVRAETTVRDQRAAVAWMDYLDDDTKRKVMEAIEQAEEEIDPQ